MTTTPFPADRYLTRLGLSQWPASTPEGLAELVCAQSRAICFENLDTLSGFELNGLLGAALQAAGFTARRRLARVSFRRPGPGPRTHLLWLVELDGETWLADAGFGGPGTVAPIRFVPGVVTIQAGARFRLLDEGEHGLHLQRWIDGDWVDVYLVDPGPVRDVDIVMGNHFTATWPTSPFRHIFMCYARCDDCFWGIQGNRLVRRNANFEAVEQREIGDADVLHAELKALFKLELPVAVVHASWQRVQMNALPPPASSA